MPIDHTFLAVSSLTKSTAFYLATLKPLNYALYLKLDTVVGLKPPRSGPDFWIGTVSSGGEGEKGEGKILPTHIAFKAGSKKAVDEFYAAALKAGAKDNGPPGYRTQYGAGYYAAYIRDPDGHNIEAMIFESWKVTALTWAPSVLGGVGIAGLAWWAGKMGWGV